MTAGRTSEELWAEAQKHLVGGVNSPVRAYRAVGGTPPFIADAEGAVMRSVDGRSYVDFIGSFGPLVLGHSHPAVVEAVREAAARGTSFAAPHEGEVDLARTVKELVPGIEKIRFVNSGTEATQSAIRLARGCTGRDLVLKFEGCYHGHVDALLVEAGSGLATFGIASSAGIPAGTARDTIVLPLDDDDALAEAFRRHGDKLAAAIIEPLPANNGLLVQRPEYLERLRRLCTEHGALLILDEVLSGFRVPGVTIGARLGIETDLYTLGKVIGGGLPVGAYGGPARLMDQLSPLGPVYQAGTLSGNPLAVAAGLATLRELQANDGWARMDALGELLDRKLGPVLEASAHPYRLVRCGSIFWLAYGGGDLPRRVDRFHPNTAEVFGLLHRGLLERGYMLAPSAYEVGFLSLAHDEESLAGFATAVGEALAEIPTP